MTVQDPLRVLASTLGDTLGEYLQDYRAAYRQTILDGPGPNGDAATRAANAYTRALDGLLGALHCAADAHSRSLAQESPPGRVALLAVGGYGRGLVGFHSDLDLLFLCDAPASARVQALAEALLYPLWDLGVEVGHAVRSVEDTLALATEDIRTATTLLDARCIAGDRALLQTLWSGARSRIFGQHLSAFVDALQEDTAGRHKRCGDSLHLLEPDVKLGQGGLRDLDVALWAAAAGFGTRGLDAIQKQRVLMAREVEGLRNAQHFLWEVRSRLHLRAKRRSERLTFADQEEIAYALGFEDGFELAVERFMQAYYRHAATVAQTSERLLARARPLPPRRQRATLRALGGGIAEFDGHITFENSEALDGDPGMALRLYTQVLKTRKPAYPFAREVIARASAEPSWCERLRADPDSGPRFVRLMTATARSGVARRSLPTELHDVRLTTAMVPEFEPLVGRVIHDVYHVYTFDVHAVRALDRLRALARGKRFDHMGLASRLAAELPRAAPLFVAAYLHVLERVQRPKGEESGEKVAALVRRLGFSRADAAHIVWLHGARRRFYDWATRRDTSDPAVLEEIAAEVGSVERLRDLYLLTVAVLSTTNPGAMTSWKARILDDLYFALMAQLDGTGISGRAAALRDDVAVGFVGDDGEDAMRAFVDGLPDRYVLANDADAIRRHARTVRDAGDFALGLGPGPSEGVSELVLWTQDRPGLLAEVCGVLAAHQVGVVGAQVYTVGTKAFDVFWARRAQEGRPLLDGERSRLDQNLRRRIEGDLQALWAGTLSPEALQAKIPRRPSWAQRHSPQVPTVVRTHLRSAAGKFALPVREMVRARGGSSGAVNGEEARRAIRADSAGSTMEGADAGPSHVEEGTPALAVVDVFTRDRVGVLQTIARTIHAEGFNIELAKINTEGERVLDVFYVRCQQGNPSPERVAGLEAALLEALTRANDEAPTPAG